MTIETGTDSVDVCEVSAAMLDELLDQEAHQALNIDGVEFTKRWFAGQYQMCDDPRITQIAMLIPGAW